MKNNANQTTSTIYYRPLKQWIDVTPEQKRDWERFVGTTPQGKAESRSLLHPVQKELQVRRYLRHLRVPLYPEGRSPASLHRH